MQIALVEDDARTRARIALHLQACLPLAKITTFDLLRTALAFAKTQPQDFWLVDLGLPDGSGVTLIRAVREQYPQAHILVISVFGDVDNILSSIHAGANGYLLKDAIDKDLQGALQAIELGGTPLSPMIASRLLERMVFPAVTAGTRATPIPPQAAAQSKLLTTREAELLNLLSRGYSYTEAGGLMGIGLSTVQTHIRHIYGKLAVTSKSEAIYEAQGLGLLRP